MSLHLSPAQSSYNSLSTSGVIPRGYSILNAPLPSNRVVLPQSMWKPSRGQPPSPRPTPPISFDVVGTRPGYGVPLYELAARDPGMQGFLDRGNDVVLQGYDKIHFRILWPGYEHVDWMRTITVTPSMTKAQLAAQVTKNFMNYLEKLQYEPVAGSMGRWKVGRGQLGMEHIQLVSLYNIGGTSFQAEVHLKFRV